MNDTKAIPNRAILRPTTHHPPPIARSDPYLAIRPYIEYLWTVDPAMCRGIYTDMFPRGRNGMGASRDDEDSFIRRFFDEETFVVQGPRFLKQVLYSIALYNDGRVVEAGDKWSKVNKGIVESPELTKYLMEVTEARKFFDLTDMTEYHNDMSLLSRVMLYIQNQVQRSSRRSQIALPDQNATTPSDTSDHKDAVHASDESSRAADGQWTVAQHTDGAGKSDSAQRDQTPLPASDQLSDLEADVKRSPGFTQVMTAAPNTNRTNDKQKVALPPQTENSPHEARHLPTRYPTNASTLSTLAVDPATMQPLVRLASTSTSNSEVQPRRMSNLSSSSRFNAMHEGSQSTAARSSGPRGRAGSHSGRGRGVGRGRSWDKSPFTGRQSMGSYQAQRPVFPGQMIPLQENWQPPLLSARNSMSRFEIDALRSSQTPKHVFQHLPPHTSPTPAMVYAGPSIRQPAQIVGGVSPYDHYARALSQSNGTSSSSNMALNDRNLIAVFGLPSDVTDQSFADLLKELIGSWPIDQRGTLSRRGNVRLLDLGDSYAAKLLLEAGTVNAFGARVRFERAHASTSRGQLASFVSPPPHLSAVPSPSAPVFSPSSFNRTPTNPYGAPLDVEERVSAEFTIRNAAGHQIPAATLGDARVMSSTPVVDGEVPTDAVPVPYSQPTPISGDLYTPSSGGAADVPVVNIPSIAPVRPNKKKNKKKSRNPTDSTSDTTRPGPEQPRRDSRESITSEADVNGIEKTDGKVALHDKGATSPISPGEKVMIEHESTAVTGTTTAAQLHDSPKDQPLQSPTLSAADALIVSKRASVQSLPDRRYGHLHKSSSTSCIEQVVDADQPFAGNRDNDVESHSVCGQMQATHGADRDSSPEPGELHVHDGDLEATKIVTDVSKDVPSDDKSQYARLRSCSRFTTLQETPNDDVDDSFRTAAESPEAELEAAQTFTPTRVKTPRVGFDSPAVKPDKDLQNGAMVIVDGSGSPTANSECATPVNREETAEKRTDAYTLDANNTYPTTVATEVSEEQQPLPSVSEASSKSQGSAKTVEKLKSGPKQTESLSPFARQAAAKKQEKRAKQKSKGKARVTSNLQQCEGADGTGAVVQDGIDNIGPSSASTDSKDEAEVQVTANGKVESSSIVDEDASQPKSRGKGKATTTNSKPGSNLLKGIPARIKSAFSSTQSMIPAANLERTAFEHAVNTGQFSTAAGNASLAWTEPGDKAVERQPVYSETSSVRQHKYGIPFLMDDKNLDHTTDLQDREATASTGKLMESYADNKRDPLEAGRTNASGTQPNSDLADQASSVTYTPTSERSGSESPAGDLKQNAAKPQSHLIEAPKDSPVGTAGKKKRKNKKKAKKKALVACETPKENEAEPSQEPRDRNDKNARSLDGGDIHALRAETGMDPLPPPPPPPERSTSQQIERHEDRGDTPWEQVMQYFERKEDRHGYYMARPHRRDYDPEPDREVVPVYSPDLARVGPPSGKTGAWGLQDRYEEIGRAVEKGKKERAVVEKLAELGLMDQIRKAD